MEVVALGATNAFFCIQSKWLSDKMENNFTVEHGNTIFAVNPSCDVTFLTRRSAGEFSP